MTLAPLRPSIMLEPPPLAVSPRGLRLLLPPAGWPIYAYVGLFPLWWLLGVSSLITVVLAAPLAVSLLRKRRVEVPPGFGVWLLFVLWVVASGVALGSDAPGTLHRSVGSLLPAYSFRLLNYCAATVVLLYVCNMSKPVLSQARLLLLQVVFLGELLVLSFLALAFPNVAFTAPLASVLPSSLASSAFFEQGTNLSFAQVQEVLGYAAPRPAAPFSYTNSWGEVLTLVLVWAVVWAVLGGRRRRLAIGLTLLVATVPIISSLNRGMWVGLGLLVVYLAFRLARRGRVAPLLALGLLLAVGGAGVLASPLASTISQRVDNGHSNRARTSISEAAITGALASPVLGYGSTRDIAGSAQTITVGRSASCPQCGNAAIGGAGHLWLVLFAQGFPGAVLYVGFFLRTIWAYRHDESPLGIGGSAVLLVGLLFALVYGHVGMPLVLYMVAAGMLWQNRRRGTAREEPA